MKNEYLKIILGAMLLMNFALYAAAATAKTRPKAIIPSAPAISKQMKPVISDYKNGDYIQAKLKLEEILENDPQDVYAKYYLALTYTQLGRRDSARQYYQDVVKSDGNMTLRYYSEKALACLENSGTAQCAAVRSNTGLTLDGFISPDEISETDNDITKFIKSGKQIHPAAADSITRERMERKMQAEEYLKKQEAQEAINNENEENKEKEENEEKQSALIPTKEEIISALNTLKKTDIDAIRTDFAYNILAQQNYANSFLSTKTAQPILHNQITGYGM